MFVFIAHAEADQAAADELKAFLKTRGLVVETETGARGFRHLQASDVVIALWSQKSVFGAHRMMMEKRMLDAWADERLVLVKLDHGLLPVGMRDLAAIDASFESGRQLSVWPQVERAAREAMNTALVAAQPKPASRANATAPPPAAAGPGPTRSVNRADDSGSPTWRYSPPAARGGGGGALLSSLAVAAVAGVSVWALIAHPDTVLHLPPLTAAIGGGGWEMDIPVFWLAIGGLALVGALIVSVIVTALSVLSTGRGRSRKRMSAPPPRATSRKRAPAASEGTAADADEELPAAEVPAPPVAEVLDAVFISYAHADNAQVDPVVKVVEASGRSVWIDKGGIQAGQGWAGEIVRGIKGATRVMVMCSPRAFESDHIKREVYLADRYKKPMLPVFIAEAQPPEDFEYFFAGVQWLELFKMPEADRPAAIGKALGTV